jgi:hypothetical protein
LQGQFSLPVSYIRSYLPTPVTPRLVHVSSAGVTRPNRPGIDVEQVGNGLLAIYRPRIVEQTALASLADIWLRQASYIKLSMRLCLQEPPAVKLNAALGGLLDFKLAGNDNG